MLFKNLVAGRLAKDYILKLVFKCWNDNNINNVSGLGVSNLFFVSNSDELRRFQRDKLGLFGGFIVKSKLAAKKLKRLI